MPGKKSLFQEFVARSGETITLEGPLETGWVVLIEFPSLDKAKAFYPPAWD
jgi:uncharacterized protein (DUF1330 family)